MRTSTLLAVVFGWLCSTATEAEVIVRRVEGRRTAAAGVAAPARPADPALTAGPAGVLGQRRDEPQDQILVPSYFVDPDAGDTTLFAVRNATAASLMITIEYFGLRLADGPQFTDAVTLGLKEVKTVNLRDLDDDLTPLPDGTFRGFVRVTGTGPEALTGDYFQVDLLEDFATGDRLVSVVDFCSVSEVRFLQGGAIDGGTLLQVLVNLPLGGDPDTDPPTLIIRAYDEDGDLHETAEVFTDQNLVTLTSDQLTLQPFGVFEVDFNLTTGVVIADYSAANRFSLGINGACLE